MHGWLGLPYLKGAPKPFRTTRGPTLQEVKPTIKNIKRIVPWSSWSERPYTKTTFRLLRFRTFQGKKTWTSTSMAHGQQRSHYGIFFFKTHQTKITEKGQPSSLLSKQSWAGRPPPKPPPQNGQIHRTERSHNSRVPTGTPGSASILAGSVTERWKPECWGDGNSQGSKQSKSSEITKEPAQVDGSDPKKKGYLVIGEKTWVVVSTIYCFLNEGSTVGVYSKKFCFFLRLHMKKQGYGVNHPYEIWEMVW